MIYALGFLAAFAVIGVLAVAFIDFIAHGVDAEPFDVEPADAWDEDPDTGTVTCPNCLGTGNEMEGFPCFECDGLGWWEV